MYFMNRIVILGGNSTSNIEWVKDLSKKLSSSLEKKTISYRHWSSGDNMIDIDYEGKKLANLLDKSDVVIAKSAGSLVLLKALSISKIKIKKAIIFGFPLKWAVNNNLSVVNLVNSLNCSSIIYQNKKEIIGTPAEINKLFKNKRVKNYELVELEGEGHYYDTSKMAEILNNIL